MLLAVMSKLQLDVFKFWLKLLMQSRAIFIFLFMLLNSWDSYIANFCTLIFRSITKSCPEFIRTSMLTYFNNTADDLGRVISNLQEKKYSYLRGVSNLLKMFSMCIIICDPMKTYFYKQTIDPFEDLHISKLCQLRRAPSSHIHVCIQLLSLLKLVINSWILFPTGLTI